MADPKTALLEKRIADLEKVVKSLSSVINATPAGLEIRANIVKVKAAAALDLEGGIIRLNNGSQPIARAGDQVSGPQGPGTILPGNGNILA